MGSKESRRWKMVHCKTVLSKLPAGVGAVAVVTGWAGMVVMARPSHPIHPVGFRWFLDFHNLTRMIPWQR